MYVALRRHNQYAKNLGRMNIRLKKIFLSVATASIVNVALSQNLHYTDSLRRIVDTTKSTLLKSHTLTDLCFYYLTSRPDSALYFGNAALVYSRNIKLLQGEAVALNGIAAAYSITGNPDKSLAYLLESKKFCEQNNLTAFLQSTIGN